MVCSQMVDVEPRVQVAESLPDVNRVAADMVARALAYCAQKLDVRDEQEALAELREGDRGACQYCGYSIAQQVGLAVGAWDDYVQSVYVVDYDATPDDLCFASEVRSLPIHLIVWTARKTRALDALLSVLDQSLSRCYQDLVGVGDLEHVLDVQVIDDADVASRMGFGAMLASIHQRPIQVWSR